MRHHNGARSAELHTGEAGYAVLAVGDLDFGTVVREGEHRKIGVRAALRTNLQAVPTPYTSLPQ
jgi:hypothetical protein